MSAEKQIVFIATPTIDGALDVRYVQSLLTTTTLLKNAGIGYRVVFEIGNSIISSARNSLVSKFMNSDATDLLFVDSDLAWQAEGVLKILGYQTDFVAGVYQRKDNQKTDFTVKFDETIQMENGLIAVKRAGTGFMRLTRSCIEQMMKANPQLKLKDKADPNNSYLYALFDNSIIDGAYVGEDYTFCDRWQQIGGQVMIDPSLNFQHWGMQPFDAKLMDFLQGSKG